MHLQKHINQLAPKWTSIRRDLHRHPEAGWTEYRTSAIIADYLQQLGCYEVHVGPTVCKSSARMGVPSLEELALCEQRAITEGANPRWIEKMVGGYTGVVGVLKTNRPGPTIAMRFDIDCIELTESNSSDHRAFQENFASTHPGLMHGCGHDGHTTIGLGVAEILAHYQTELSGEVRLLFQPAEEGCRGAKAVVEAGWLDQVDQLFCAHLFPNDNFQVAGAIHGFLATTKIDATFHGKASHAGATPELGKNALLAAATATVQLNTIPRHSGGASRINVGTLIAESGRNVIADEATMKLETRGETTEINHYMREQAVNILHASAQMYDVTCNWRLAGEGDHGTSSRDLIPLIGEKVDQIKQKVTFIPEMTIRAGSEDAIYMLNKVQEQGGQAVYMGISGPPPAPTAPHQKNYDFHEDLIAIGVELFSRIALSTE
ncbi:amidohydrolase [Shimazuella kribbensis]|uniref:amidohydrolase n=1 Tax=Shimazuella kribbensis TaxID=139808 RepID=UPI00040FA099|nr:amidohydrolase [Shimazuella kribbensis]